MLKKLGEKIFGTSDDREIKKMQKLVNKINEIEPIFEKLTDEQLQHKTVEFKDWQRSHLMTYWWKHLRQ